MRQSRPNLLVIIRGCVYSVSRDTVLNHFAFFDAIKQGLLLEWLDAKRPDGAEHRVATSAPRDDSVGSLPSFQAGAALPIPIPNADFDVQKTPKRYCKTMCYVSIHDREFCPLSLRAVLKAAIISCSLAPELGGTVTVSPARGLWVAVRIT